MGVQLSEIVESREIELHELAGKKIAIDAFNIIFQFLTIIRDRLTGEPLKDSKGRVTSHLSGLFYRTTNLLELGIKPVYVFDGPPPEFKRKTLEEREELKLRAEEKWKEAVAKGKPAFKYAQAAARLDEEMVETAKKLLELMGVPVVQAASEGEIQAAFLAKRGDVWASASQDYDSLLVGSPRLVRNISISGKRKLPNKEVYVEVKPELIELGEMLTDLGITQEQLIIVGLLVGTDYNPGVKGVGPKKALELVKTEKTLENVLKKVEWRGDVPAEELYEFFLNPPVNKKYKLIWGKPKFGKLIEFLVGEHNFSRERVEKVIERLQNISKDRQTSLGKFM